MANIPIITPYDFIPVSSWVFSPDWAKDVTHDVPFRGGLSGRIKYELVNYSPLCVGHDTADRKTEEGKSVKTVIWEHDGSGRQVIPGSSIKGMLRNALEIVGFGKMQCVRDIRHAARLGISDVKSESADYTLTPIFARPDPENPGNWQYLEAVANTGHKPVTASIDASHLKDVLKIKDNSVDIASLTALQKHQYLAERFKKSKHAPMPLLYAELELQSKMSQEQNDKFNSTGDRCTTWYEVISVSETKDATHTHPGMFLFMNKNIANGYNKKDGKPKKANQFTDYFFCVHDEAIDSESGRWKLLEDWLVKELKASLPAVKADGAGKKDQNLFDYNVSHQHPKFGFPVWLLEHKTNYRESALGFCQVPRHVREKSVMDMIRDVQKETANIQDLADTMFGCITDTEGSGSRIGFSDLIAEEKYPIEPLDDHIYILGEPKSTFFPVYLGKFNNNNGAYKDGSIIAGRKVYKIRKDFKMAKQKLPNENTDVRSSAEFVVPQSKFQGTVVFHNLKPEELGALLWVMTHGKGTAGASSPFYHSLGHARPMGAGAVKLNITAESITLPPYLINNGEIDLGPDIQGNEQKCSEENLIPTCLARFEERMNFEYPFRGKNQLREWRNSKIISFYLEKAKANASYEVDGKFDKIYNAFSEEFTDIRKEYTSTSKGGGGKQSGPAFDVFRFENDKGLNKGLNLVREEKKANLWKVQQAEAKAKEEERKRQEEQAARDAQKQALGSEYQQHLDAGNFHCLCALAILNNSAREMFNKDLASGRIAAEWNCTTANQLLKQMDPAYENTDADSRNKYGEDVFNLLYGNELGRKPFREYRKKKKGKTWLGNLLDRLIEAEDKKEKEKNKQ